MAYAEIDADSLMVASAVGCRKHSVARFGVMFLGAKNRNRAYFDKLLRKVSEEIGKNVSLYQAEFCKTEYKIKIPRFKFKADV